MRFIKTRDEFCQHKAEVHSLIDFSKELPSMVFKEAKDFYLLCIDDVLSRNFFSDAKILMQDFGDQTLYLMVLDPDPENYFYRNFKVYSLIEAAINDSDSEYFDLLQQDPGDSPADAILFNSSKLVIYGNSLRWMMYLDRSYDICVFGLCDFPSKQISKYGKTHAFSVQDLSISNGLGDNFSDEFYQEFVQNYSTID